MKRRVVITGIGLVTPLGWRRETFWTQLIEGRSGVGPITTFDASDYPVRIAAEVRDWNLSNLGENPSKWLGAPRQTEFAIGAGIEAVRDSGFCFDKGDPTSRGVYLGCGEPFTQFKPFTTSIARAMDSGEFAIDKFEDSRLRLFDANSHRHFDPNMPSVALAAKFNAQGPNLNCIAACVSATQAIGQSVRMIRRGEADVMLCGGAHSCIHELGLTGFTRLSALSGRNESPAEAIRPFDRDRDGFVIGEGAAVLLAEELDHARRRGAKIYGEVSGYGSSQDAFRVTDTHPQGRGTVQAIQKALKDSRLNSEDIGYINAHGTGTLLNDKVETHSLKIALGDPVRSIPVSSTKSMLGHATTACGAIEVAVALLSLHSDVLPPTINYSTPDPSCDLDYVPNAARRKRCQHILSNNIGFGGQNAAICHVVFSHK